SRSHLHAKRSAAAGGDRLDGRGAGLLGVSTGRTGAPVRLQAERAMMARPGEGEAIVLRRRIPASRDEVFAAWIDGDGMRAWMCPGDITSADVQLDPRVGGALRILMHGPNGSYEHWGEFTAFERPSKLAFTWCAKATDFLPTLVTVEFREAP